MNPVLARLLVGRENQYPSALEEQFPRVFNEIIRRWDTEEFDAMFQQLFLSDRVDRMGFPFQVMKELMFLQELHEEAKNAPKGNDVWGNVITRRGLETEGIEYSEKGFFQAVEQGNLTAIKLFLDAGVDVNIQNDIGWTPLMVAIFSSNEAAANMLLKAGASCNARDKRGYGPLHWAAYRGYTKVITQLLDSGVSVNLRSNAGVTPLIQAAAMGHENTVALLIESGARVNDPDSEGWTPLHKAVANGYTKVAEILLNAGANPNLPHSTGLTAKDIAMRKQQMEMLYLFANPL